MVEGTVLSAGRREGREAFQVDGGRDCCQQAEEDLAECSVRSHQLKLSELEICLQKSYFPWELVISNKINSYKK